MITEDRESLKTHLMKQLRPRLMAPPYREATRLVLAVSGGRDSCVLLDVFWRMRHVHRAPLQVVHIDHHTGAYSQRARQLVESLCAERSLSLTVVDFHWDGDGNFEHRASSFRREALAQAHGEDGYAVLAHHREDQSETVIMALARGAGLTSPLGMQPQRDRRLRPLLDIAATSLADHARRAELNWCEDPSNRDEEKFRNAVRHSVLPVLTHFHERVGNRIAGWVAEYQDLQAALFQQARQILARGTLWEQSPGVWVLQRGAFHQTPDYLWPFLLAEFWTASKVPKPKRREHQKVMGWLEEDEVGCFDHAGQRFYCDRDVLVFAPKPELIPKQCRLNQPVNWGLWRLRVDWLGAETPWTATMRAQGFQLVAGEPLPKSFRDRIRRARLPIRVRQHLPAMRVGSIQLHFGELFALQAKGHLRVVRESGPDWHC